MLEDANEVQDVLGRSYGMPEIDEDELEAELDALGDDIALDEDTSYLDEISAPNAPTKEPGADSVAVNADGVMVAPIQTLHFIYPIHIFTFTKVSETGLCLSLWASLAAALPLSLLARQDS